MVVGIVVLLGGVWVVSIQAGGGGVDVGAWSEEAELLGPETTFCEEPEPGVYESTDGAQEIRLSQSRPRIQKNVRIGPVPLDRESRSESSVPNLSPQETIPVRHSLSDIQPQEQQTSPSGRRRNSLLSSSTSSQRPGLDAHSTLPVSPTYHTRYALRHRLASNELLLHHGSRNASYHHHTIGANGGVGGGSGSGSSGSGPLSPPLNAVSSLGPGGLQIGLSPVSPGFTIMPRERKPRISGKGRPSTMGDLERDLERRRTVSEGDINGRRRRGYGSMALDGGEDEETGNGGEERPAAAGEAPIPPPHPSTTVSEVGTPGGNWRWGWLRRFVRRRKE